MHGNVWEWVQDWYGEYSAEMQTNPIGPKEGSARVLRGGAWSNNAGHCRAASRSLPDTRHRLTGFRLARLGKPTHSYTLTLEAFQSQKQAGKPVYQQGEVIRDQLADGSTGPEMVYVPEGTFRMGNDKGGRVKREKPAHEITLDHFAAGKYPVTFEEYDKFCEATGKGKPRDTWGRGRHPVYRVSWEDATAYCGWLSAQTGETYTLLTEAQWEYVCRADSDGAYCFGDEEKALERYAWYAENAKGRAHLIGEKQANRFGLYDMHGNVWEWVQDWFGDYPGEPQTNPVGPESGSARVCRGGSWGHDADGCRSAFRIHYDPADRNLILGFRIARTIS